MQQKVQCLLFLERGTQCNACTENQKRDECSFNIQTIIVIGLCALVYVMRHKRVL